MPAVSSRPSARPQRQARVPDASRDAAEEKASVRRLCSDLRRDMWAGVGGGIVVRLLLPVPHLAHRRRERRFGRRRSARRRSRKRRLFREPVVGQLRLQGQVEARERAQEGRARGGEERHRRWNAHPRRAGVAEGGGLRCVAPGEGVDALGAGVRFAEGALRPGSRRVRSA